MDKVILKNSDIEVLLKWRDEHKDLVRKNDCPLSAVEIQCVESGYKIKGIRKGDELKLYLNKGISYGSMTFRILPSGYMEKVADRMKTDAPQNSLADKENKQSILTVYSSLMALMAHSRYFDLPEKETAAQKRERKSSNSSKKKSVSSFAYIIRFDREKPVLVRTGGHMSPSCIFSVRGHFRHYKNGKVVWIDEFVKGKGNKKDKTYKLK